MEANKENNNTPNLRTYHEITKDVLRKYLLDVREKVSEVYNILMYNKVGFGALGEIQANTGHQKGGKTFTEVMFMSAILEPGSTRVSQYLPGLEVPERTLKLKGGKLRVLYVDTEQSKLYSMKVARRVHWLCGWPLDEPNERFTILHLRTVEDDPVTDEKAYQIRFRLIMYAIEEYSPDVVFIDNLRDLVADFNNNEQSAALINKLMSTAQKKNISIWNALHYNPRPGNDDVSKMRGHLGTELSNKVSDTFLSSKKKTGNDVIFTVKQADARGRDVDDFSFVVCDDAGGLGIPKIIKTPSTDETTITDESINALRDILQSPGISLNWTAIRKELIKRFEISQGQSDKIIKAALKYKILTPIECAGRTTYKLNHDFGDDNELPFV